MSKKTNIIKQWQNKEWLYDQYFNKKLSFKSIGNLCGRTDRTVAHFFYKFGFKSRPSPFLNPEKCKGSNHPNWRGGRIYNTYGYILSHHPEPHDYKGKNQCHVLEHVLIMEKKLGRKLKHPEIVHHKNGILDDNREENLQLMSNPTEHNTYEQTLCNFSKNILYGNLAPHLKSELLTIFNNFLSSIVNER